MDMVFADDLMTYFRTTFFFFWRIGIRFNVFFCWSFFIFLLLLEKQSWIFLFFRCSDKCQHINLQSFSTTKLLSLEQNNSMVMIDDRQ